MTLFLTVIITILSITRGEIFRKTCMEAFSAGPKGATIKIVPKPNNSSSISCTWTIDLPYNTITTIHIRKIDLQNCPSAADTCICYYNGTLLQISSARQNYLTLCGNKTGKSLISVKEEDAVNVDLENYNASSSFWLEFTFRNATECPKSEFQCLDKSGCYNHTDICNGPFACQDGGDEANCLSLMQNCTGQDQYFQCNNGRCINRTLINNNRDDCGDNSDETTATNKSVSLIIIIIIFGSATVLAVVFSALIYRWFNTRRDITRLLQNLPDIPLPPFEGPGEHDYSSSRFSEADFRIGGEIYDAFIQSSRGFCENRRERHKKKTLLHGLPNSNDSVRLSINSMDNELLALASLDVPKEMCIGLELLILETTPDESDFNTADDWMDFIEEQSIIPAKASEGCVVEID